MILSRFSSQKTHRLSLDRDRPCPIHRPPTRMWARQNLTRDYFLYLSHDQIYERQPRTIHKRSRMTNNNNHHQPLSSARDVPSFEKHEEDRVTKEKIDVFDSFTTESTINRQCPPKHVENENRDEDEDHSLPSIVCLTSSYPTTRSTTVCQRGKQHDSSHRH